MTNSLVKKLRSQIGDDVQEIYLHEALFKLAADRLEQMDRLLGDMAQLLRVADFEDLGDYHASLDVLSKYKEISND